MAAIALGTFQMVSIKGASLKLQIDCRSRLLTNLIDWINAMNDMTPVKSPLERFSAGEISRVELGKLIGHPISFGDMLMQLHEHHLPLPRYGRSFNPEGVELIRQLAERNKDG